MREEHSALNKLGDDLRTLQSQYENREKNIEETAAKVQSLQKEYDRFQKHRTALDKLKIMKQKKLWLEYHERKTDFEDSKRISVDKKKELQVGLPARYHRCCFACAPTASRPPGRRPVPFLIRMCRRHRRPFSYALRVQDYKAKAGPEQKEVERLKVRCDELAVAIRDLKKKSTPLNAAFNRRKQEADDLQDA